jgi:hypothetical protein
MKKRWTLLILVVLATLIAAAPALAAGPGNQNQKGNQYQQANQNQQGSQNQHRHQVGEPQPHNGQIFTLTGTITVIGTDSITVLVRNGNRLIKPYIGQELVVQVTESTRYRQWTPEGCVPITFEDLEVGDTASMEGTASEEVFTAARVTVDVPCCTP